MQDKGEGLSPPLEPAAPHGAPTARSRSRPDGSLDQAAVAFAILTSARRVEVMAGPAGSGKTRTVAELARIWREHGAGEVIGLTTSQTTANVLSEAGVARAYNTARFLGRTQAGREARGALPVPPGSLLIVDEASMVSLADLAAIARIAHSQDCKVVVTGDHEQVAAVEGGGAMMMLARRLGHLQLAEPQRFAHAWERDASLRLRAGDVTVLTEYSEHGRVRGGAPDEAFEQAYRGWLADFLDGRDTLLIARTEEQARELSRRARDDLIRCGRVAAGPGLRLAHGERANVGNLVMARRNRASARAGRALANLAGAGHVPLVGGPPEDLAAASGRQDAAVPGAQWELLLEGGNAQFRRCRTALYHSLYRADDHLLVSQHAQGGPPRPAAVLHLVHSPEAAMTGTYFAEFERIWAQASPFG